MPSRGERGQTMVEFALVIIVLFALTAGMVDIGRGFYQYNALSDLARFAARWAGVVGGSCALPYAQSTSDFCNQLGSQTGNFWAQSGNTPIQGFGNSCPTYSSTPGDYYTASNFTGSKSTTVVGAIVAHFDSNSTNTGFAGGPISPGFNLSRLYVCIATSSTTSVPSAGDSVTVALYTQYVPAAPFLSRSAFPLTATASYEVE